MQFQSTRAINRLIRRFQIELAENIQKYKRIQTEIDNVKILLKIAKDIKKDIVDNNKKG